MASNFQIATGKGAICQSGGSVFIDTSGKRRTDDEEEEKDKKSKPEDGKGGKEKEEVNVTINGEPFSAKVDESGHIVIKVEGTLANVTVNGSNIKFQAGKVNGNVCVMGKGNSSTLRSSSSRGSSSVQMSEGGGANCNQQ